MRINYKDPNPGVFFKWPEEKAISKNGITIRILNAETAEEIENKVVKKTNKIVDGKIVEEKVIDDKLNNELLWKYCIVNWTGLFDEDNKPIECTDDNKIYLMRKSVTFANFVIDCLNVLGDTLKKKEEQAEKN